MVPGTDVSTHQAHSDGAFREQVTEMARRDQGISAWLSLPAPCVARALVSHKHPQLVASGE